MDTRSLLEALTPAQRIDMVMKGLRPGSQADVKKYMKGEKISSQEQIERVRTLAGNFTNLGGAHEKEEYVQPDVILDENAVPISRPQKTKSSQGNDLRRQLNEQMDGYVGGTTRVIESSDILSLRKPMNENVVTKQSSIHKEGYNNAKAYLNAFVTNLQTAELSTSYKLRMEVFRALKICMEGEIKYKEDKQKLREYRNGVLEAEQKLFASLQ